MGMRCETALLFGAVGLLLLTHHATSIPRADFDLGRQIVDGAPQMARQLKSTTSSISPNDSDLLGVTDAADGKLQKGGQKKKKQSWWKGKGKTGTKEPEYKGPAGAKQAKFDDKAAEEVINKMRSAGQDLSKNLGLKRSKLPDVKELSRKGWHFQLPNATILDPSKKDNTPKEKQEAKEKDRKMMKKEAEKELKEAGLSVAEKQANLKAEKVEKDEEIYKNAFANIAKLADKIKEKRKHSLDKMVDMPDKLKKKFLKMQEKNNEQGAKQEKKPPSKPSQWEFQNKMEDKKFETQKAVAFDEAVFDQIRQAEAESGQKLRPGAYFKILDKNGNGVLERGESDAVDELFQTGDIMSGGITGEEAPSKITYEQYKKGIRDAKKNYEKLFKGAGRGHVFTGAN